MVALEPQEETTHPAYLVELLRHFADLRDGVHGATAVTRGEKELLFRNAANFMDPAARQALGEVNRALLLDTGTVSATGVVRDPTNGVTAAWTLEWPEQQRAGLPPVTLLAFYGRGFHHPHLRGRSVGNWPLNVFSASDGTETLPTLRAIAAAELHNLVFESDYRIVPATLHRRDAAALHSQGRGAPSAHSPEQPENTP